MTDLDYMIPLIRKNISANLSAVRDALKPTRHVSSNSLRRPKAPGSGNGSPANEDDWSGAVSIEPLDWLELQQASPHVRDTCFRLTHGGPPDLIIVADCVYNPTLLPALVDTIDYYAEAGCTHVLVAVELRSADVVREFLELWTSSGEWVILRIGSADSGDDDKRYGYGWLGVEFAVWVGWKKNDERGDVV